MARPRTAAGRARETHARLAHEYPGSAAELCELDHRSPYELLVATILSAQSTDKMINSVTPKLFARYPDPVALAGADEALLQEMIRSSGFFNAKSRSLLGMARAVVERFDAEIPDRMADLVSLPGVGRKTANVVLSVAFAKPGLPVDTHVLRLSKRLALTTQEDPVGVEHELSPMLPAAGRGPFSSRLILHGRRVCVARRPRCEDCVLADFCPSSLTA
ncbi:MAG: endonuclease III [Solirubrobacteraceae bacterium]